MSGSPYHQQSCSDGERWSTNPWKCVLLDEPSCCFSNTDGVTTSQPLTAYGGGLFSSSQPKASCPFYAVTNKNLSMKPALRDTAAASAEGSLSPGFSHAQHSSPHFHGEDISAPPLCKGRMEVDRAFVCCCCSSACSSSISGQLCLGTHRNLSWSRT